MFTDSTIYLCDFHREQAWERWVSATKNGVASHKEEILGLLRKLAHSKTTEEYDRQFKELKAKKIWKENVKMQAWFSSRWDAFKEVSLYQDFIFLYWLTLEDFKLIDKWWQICGHLNQILAYVESAFIIIPG